MILMTFTGSSNYTLTLKAPTLRLSITLYQSGLAAGIWETQYWVYNEQ